MVIYYTHAFGNTKGESHRLLEKAVTAYAASMDTPCDAAGMVASMKTGEYGKPYIPGFVPFSISHSGNTWAVLIGGEGLDIQYPRRVDAAAVSLRFFAPEDSGLIRGILDDGEGAEDAFFRLWTRREALVKAAGTSVAGTDIPSVINDTAEYDGVDYHIEDVEIPGGKLYAAVCTEECLPLRITEL